MFCLDEWWVGLMGWSPAPSVKHGNWLHRAASQTLFEEINVFATIVFLKGRHDIKITWWFISFLWNLSSAENHELSSPRFDPNRSPYPISVIVLVLVQSFSNPPFATAQFFTTHTSTNYMPTKEGMQILTNRYKLLLKCQELCVFVICVNRSLLWIAPWLL